MKDRATLVEIYTLQCRSALNKDYYGERLVRFQQYNTVLEISIALGTTGSGLSAISGIWDTAYGKPVWAGLAAVSAALAVAKPILQTNQKVERYSKLFAGFSELYISLIAITGKIRRRQELSTDLVNAYEEAELRFLELSKYDEARPKIKLLERCHQAVAARHPQGSFWYPDSDKDEPRAQSTTADVLHQA